MAKVISILMNKGGVSKTETSLNLAYGLSVKGKKVLLIDMDPSSNAQDRWETWRQGLWFLRSRCWDTTLSLLGI